MMYPYVRICKDQTEVSFSQIIQENEIDTIEVHFERPGKKGFDEASIKLPNYEWIYNNGYSDEEIKYFTKFQINYMNYYKNFMNL